MNLKVYIETYGCQMNVGDSQVAASILTKEGYAICNNMEQADVILVNTCSVNSEKIFLRPDA
ncbi:MAG: tRNA (N6-isopentenyl adenosine(37)-C2)-methylthiotransferase MiaB, partial [Bacteroidales bacterium]|nr:tRNA (N6-isopentenyl adenosine(37)-C2)-methylthiotransferase MiaB [Bacteroidales bacterium]